MYVVVGGTVVHVSKVSCDGVIWVSVPDMICGSGVPW